MSILKKSIILFIGLTFIGCEEIDTLNSNLNQNEIATFSEKFINSSRCNQIIDKEFITICYDYKLKSARAVSYTLDGDLVNELNINKRPSFYVEKAIEFKYRISTTDYINSGYDRGHLAPDASFDWSEESLKSVYSLANIIPQAPQVNRNSWADLEKYVRDKAIELNKLTVLNIVKFGERYSRMGKNGMAISKGYYKVIYNKDESYEECFYYINKLGDSNSGDTIDKHRVSCLSVIKDFL